MILAPVAVTLPLLKSLFPPLRPLDLAPLQAVLLHGIAGQECCAVPTSIFATQWNFLVLFHNRKKSPALQSRAANLSPTLGFHRQIRAFKSSRRKAYFLSLFCVVPSPTPKAPSRLSYLPDSHIPSTTREVDEVLFALLIGSGRKLSPH